MKAQEKPRTLYLSQHTCPSAALCRKRFKASSCSQMRVSVLLYLKLKRSKGGGGGREGVGAAGKQGLRAKRGREDAIPTPDRYVNRPVKFS